MTLIAQNLINAALTPSTTTTRRAALTLLAGAAGALVLELRFAAPASAAEPRVIPDMPPAPDAYIRIGSDNTVTVVSKFLDKGQGIVTGIATLAAEELDADWAQVRYAYAPAEVARYKNHLLGVQGVGASTAMASAYNEMRRAGAAARAMLVSAAAKTWNVPEREISVSKGVISHGRSGKKAAFGTFAAAAAAFPVPQQVTLKDPKNFTLIGVDKPLRLDSAAKSNAKETFGLDVRLPGMLRAVLARPPKFGATLSSIDDSASRSVKGVVNVTRVGNAVAVLATSTWAAMKGRDALKLSWDFSQAEQRSTATVYADYRKLAESLGKPATETGDAAGALSSSKQKLEAEFLFPFLAHAPLEPLNAVVQVRSDGAEIWTGCQFQTVDQLVAATALGLKPDQVTINTLMAGGSFGRRANPAADYIREAALVAKAADGKPVQTLWSRTDDLHGGYYRAQFLHKVTAGLDENGRINAWDHRIVGQSIGEGTALEKYLVSNGVDYTSVEGARENLYGVPNFRCGLHTVQSKVPVLWWRSVGHSHTTYAVETLIDDLSKVAKQDAVAFRLAHLGDRSPRMSQVLKLVADKSDWSKPLPAGRARGVSIQHCYGSYIAHVAEVSVGSKGEMKVERITAAVDCGVPVNPDVIRAQIEGGAAYGLSSILYSAITFADGIVEQDNFDTYPLLRMSGMPRVEVHIIPSSERPTGIGEPPVPNIGPAVANAYFAATGKRFRELPLAKHGIV